MSEWSVVLVVISLVGLLTAVVSPIIKLNSTIAKLNYAVDRLNEKLEETIQRNHKIHDTLFETQRDFGIRLNDHEKRIHTLENKTAP